MRVVGFWRRAQGGEFWDGGAILLCELCKKVVFVFFGDGLCVLGRCGEGSLLTMRWGRRCMITG